MSRWFAIINGAAGGGSCAGQADAMLTKIRLAGHEVEAVRTEHAGHATELAREAFSRGERNFISVGGDGTTYEVINGLFPAAEGESVQLGILPLGTGNSFLRDFGIADPKSAVERFLRQQTSKVDICKLDHRDGSLVYINLLGIGFTADVGSLTNDRFKAFGPAGYVMAVLFSLAKLGAPTLEFEVDGARTRFPSTFCSFSNSKYTGGEMMMAPLAKLDDGHFDMIRVERIGRLGLLRAFPMIFKGTHLKHPAVSSQHVKEVRFVDSVEQDLMIDGEIVRLTPEKISVLPSAIEVVA